MIEPGSDAIFIIWAYVGVAIGVIGLVAWTLFDARATAARLASLEAQAPRRRTSEPAA